MVCATAIGMFLILHRWTYTRATWRNSVMMKLKQYQIELQQSIDFTHFHEGNFTLPEVKHETFRLKKSEHSVLKMTKNQSYHVNVTTLFVNAKKCLKDTRHQIAVHLNSKFGSDFSLDTFTKTKIKAVLEPKCKRGLHLIIIVTTRPSAFYQRSGIRHSWGRIDSDVNQYIFRGRNFKYMTIFTIGRDENPKIERLIELESEKFKDILRLDYSDTYENLTNKTILTLEWVGNQCEPQYILKTDDDCFVNLFAIEPWFQTLNKKFDYIGKKNEFMPVIRDPWHRNYVPFDDFGEEYYKPYCSGGGYMLSGRVLKNVTKRAKTMKQIINEDAFLGMVTNSLNIHPEDEERFLPFIFSKRNVNKRNMCDWKAKFLMHGVKPERQIAMYWNTLAMIRYPFLCDNHKVIIEEDA